MQQTFGFKRFVVTHAGAAALLFGVLLSTALGVTALTATGNLPWMHDNAAPGIAQQPQVQAQRNEQMAAFFDAKLARLEADELHASTVMAQSVAHEKLLRFYARKEERLLAFSTPAAAASDVQTIHGLDGVGAIAVLHASARH